MLTFARTVATGLLVGAILAGGYLYAGPIVEHFGQQLAAAGEAPQ